MRLCGRLLLSGVLFLGAVAPAFAAKSAEATIRAAAGQQARGVAKVRRILSLAQERDVNNAMGKTLIHGQLWISPGVGTSRVTNNWSLYKVDPARVSDAELATIDPSKLLTDLAEAVGMPKGGKVSMAGIRRHAGAAKAQRIAVNQLAASLAAKHAPRSSTQGTFIGSVTRGSNTDVRLWLSPDGLLVNGDPSAEPFDLTTYDGPLTGPVVATSTPMTEQMLRRQFATARRNGHAERTDLGRRSALLSKLDALWQSPGFPALASTLAAPVHLGTRDFGGDLYLTTKGFQLKDSTLGNRPLDQRYLELSSWGGGEGLRSTTRRDAKGHQAPLEVDEALDLIAGAVKR